MQEWIIKERRSPLLLVGVMTGAVERLMSVLVMNQPLSVKLGCP